MPDDLSLTDPFWYDDPAPWTNGDALRHECAWCGCEIGPYVPHLRMDDLRACASCCAASGVEPETLAQLDAVDDTLRARFPLPPAPLPPRF